jgi:hypothetical protein
LAKEVLVAGIRDLRKIQSDNEELSRVQDLVGECLQPVLQAAILDGVLLKDLTLTPGANSIEHKLGRKPLGWIVVGLNASASIWDSQEANTFKTRTLALNSSANCVVTLWIF